MGWLTAITAFFRALIPGLAFFLGRRSATQAQELKDAKAYQQTRQRLDKVKPMADPAAARKWLSKRGGKL